MSEYYVCKSQISDIGCLKDALRDIGMPEGCFTQHETPQELNGYHRKEYADIIVSKAGLKTSHDVGFKQNADGTYDILVYDGDVRCGIGNKMTPTIRGGTGELMQHYAKHVILKTAKAKYGHRAKATIKDGRIKIKVDVS